MITKERNRPLQTTSGYEDTYWDFYDGGLHFVSASYGTVTANASRKETITYDPGPQFGKHGLNFKRCYQTKTRSYFCPIHYRQVPYVKGNVTGYGFKCRKSEPLRLTRAYSLASLIDQPLPEIPDLYSRLQQEIDGTCQNDTFLLSTAAELFEGANPVKTGLDILKSFKNIAKKRTFRDTIGGLASSDLAYKFGILTAVSDINVLVGLLFSVQESAEKLAWRNAQKSVVFKQTAENSDTVDTIQQYPNLNAFMGTRVNGPVKLTASSKRTLFCRAAVKYDQSDSYFTYNILERLGLLTPLGTAWDLLPFSFVIDYFLDIQSKIQSLEDAVKSRIYKPLQSITMLSPVWCADKVSKYAELTGLVANHTTNTIRRKISWDPTRTNEVTTFARYPLSPDQLSSLPSWDINTSLTARQHLNLVELLAQRLTRS